MLANILCSLSFLSFESTVFTSLYKIIDSYHGLNLNNGIGTQVNPTVSRTNDFLPQTSDRAPMRGALRNDKNPYKKFLIAFNARFLFTLFYPKETID